MKCLKSKCKQKIATFYSEIVPLTRDVTNSNIWRYGEHTDDTKLSGEHTSIVPTLKYT